MVNPTKSAGRILQFRPNLTRHNGAAAEVWLDLLLPLVRRCCWPGPLAPFLSSCGSLAFSFLPSQTQVRRYFKSDCIPLLHHSIGIMPLLTYKRSPTPSVGQAQAGRLFGWVSKLGSVYRSVEQLATRRINKGQLYSQPNSALPDSLSPKNSTPKVQQVEVVIPTPSINFSASSEALTTPPDTPIDESRIQRTPPLEHRLRPGSLGRKSSVSRSPYKFKFSS